MPEGSGQVQGFDFLHTQSKSRAMHAQVSKPSGEMQTPKAKPSENSEPPGIHKEVRQETQLSPAYLNPEEGIWEQNYLF